MIDGIDHMIQMLQEEQYVADRALATTLYLAVEMRKPLLVEGYAGVGKTEIAKVLAQILETRLIRLQCYEGLDAASSLYEWNFPKQILRATALASSALSEAEREQAIFSGDDPRDGDDPCQTPPVRCAHLQPDPGAE